MFEKISNGLELIKLSLKIFKKHPLFIIPILVVWVLYAPLIIYIRYYLDWSTLNTHETVGLVFLILFAICFMMLISCSIVLEIIQQIETGKKISLINAVGETIGFDLIKIIPLAFVWAILLLILTIIESLFSKKETSTDEELSAQNAAITLANYKDISLSTAFINAIKKGLRMLVFLMMPAIAWEDLSFTTSIKRGFSLLRSHTIEFATGYILTDLTASLIFLPVAIIFYVGVGRHGNPPIYEFSQSFWTGTILYIGLAWSFCIYLEQMFTATLYLWHLKWEKEIQTAKEKGLPLPAFTDIKQPSLLDDTPDLIKM